MSLAMDKALMALSLDEEDVPFSMPELPGFSSAEENKLSLMGRILNPERQKMSSLIMKMPRKWQKEGRVRGIALFQERFQFIFQNEYDLMDVLERGVHTFEEWVIVLERWVENPPEDYLHYIPLWVQISKIPVDCYNTGALTALGDLVGKTVLVAFDPSKPVTQDFIRVLVKFNVVHPLRMSKVITLKGVPVVIHFNYEKVQKRCFECQRLNHEKDHCPLVVRKRQEESRARREMVSANLKQKELVLKPDDILYEVLDEDQVGCDPATGRWKIAKEVLEEMRRYMRADTGESHVIKVDKILTSVRMAEKDPMLQRTVLRLEQIPFITNELNKGKGLVFNYKENLDVESDNSGQRSTKFMADSFKAHSYQGRRTGPTLKLLCSGHEEAESEGALVSVNPMVFKAEPFTPCSSGMAKKHQPPRRRSPKAVRSQRSKMATVEDAERSEEKRDGKQEIGSKKRNSSVEVEELQATNKATCLMAIPNEGSPSSQ
ncbi:hypothetical protein Bca4012_010059 [Brassica carinata]